MYLIIAIMYNILRVNRVQLAMAAFIFSRMGILWRGISAMLY